MKHLYLLAILGLPCLGHGQSVGIGTNSPSSSAALEVRSSNQGLLPPRLTTAQMNAISNAEEGLLIFNTSQGKFYGYRRANFVVSAGGHNASSTPTSFNAGILVGQSFTPNTFGLLTTLSLNLRSAANVPSVSGSLTIKVYAGDGLGGAELGSATQTVTLTPSGANFNLNLSSAEVTVKSNQVYTFYITASTFDGGTAVNFLLTPTDSYSGGQLYSNGAAVSTRDMVFSIGVFPFQWMSLE